MGGPASNGISRAPLYLGSRLRGIGILSTRLSLSAARFSNTVRLSQFFVTLRKLSSASLPVLLPPNSNDCCLTLSGFGLAPVRSPLLGGSLRFLFLRVLRCFTSPGCSPFRCHGTASVGLPHSEVRGSMPACGSPRRFAACCVFRRPYVPRHPSGALYTLTCFGFVLFGCQGALRFRRFAGFCGFCPLKRNDEESLSLSGSPAS